MEEASSVDLLLPSLPRISFYSILSAYACMSWPATIAMGTKSNSNNNDGGSAEQQQRQRPPIDSLKSDDDIPACQACRRKKAKCSREQPCSQCVRLDTPCIYEGRRLKPGLRAGVIDSLSRRIETLEDMFLGQEILWKQMWQTLHPNLEFPGIPSAAGNDTSIGNGTDLRGRRDQLKNSLLDLANIHRRDSSNFGIDISSGSGDMSQPPPAKRQRRDLSPPPSSVPVQEQHEDIPQYMTTSDIMDSELMTNFVEFYFQNIHHWIPILHVRRFRDQIQYPEGRKKAVHILHAIIAVGIRFVHDPRLGDDETKAKTAETSRQNVVLSSMESFSVQSLQALVIIAFDTVRSLKFLSAFYKLISYRLLVDVAHPRGLLWVAWHEQSNSYNSASKKTTYGNENKPARHSSDEWHFCDLQHAGLKSRSDGESFGLCF